MCLLLSPFAQRLSQANLRTQFLLVSSRGLMMIFYCYSHMPMVTAFAHPPQLLCFLADHIWDGSRGGGVGGLGGAPKAETLPKPQKDVK